MFFLTEKRNWLESKSENSSSNQISFQFYILVSSPASSLPELGLNPKVRIVLRCFQQIIEDKEGTFVCCRSHYTHISQTQRLCAHGTLDLGHADLHPIAAVSLTLFLGWAAHHITEPRLSTLWRFLTLPSKLSFLPFHY